MNTKSLVKLCGIALATAAATLAPASAQVNTNPLVMTFTNTSGMNASNIYVSISDNASLNFVNDSVTNVTWSAGNLYSDPISLATLNANGGLSITNANSTAFYISYGGAMTNLTTAPSPLNPTDQLYNYAWQELELTKASNGTGNGVGDLTYINEFSAELGITSYDSNNNVLATSGFGSNSTATVFSQLANLTAYSPTTVLTNTATNVTQYTRVVAPVSYGNSSVGGYNDFHNYIVALATNNTTATLYNASAFLVSNNATTNYQYTFTMTSSYTTNGFIYLNGNVNQTQTAGGTNNATYSNLTILYSNSSTTNIGAAIYGANYTSASNTIFFQGTNWTQMSNAMVAIYGTPTNPAYTTGSNAYYTVLAQMVGELSSTLESGLAGSTNLVNNGPVSNTNTLGSYASSNWWQMTNTLPIMGNAQTNTNNYDQYGNVIFQNSSNSVYNFSYNDRYNNAKPVIFSEIDNGTNVASWVINVGQPISGVPEPSYNWAILALLLGGAAFKFSRTKKKA